MLAGALILSACSGVKGKVEAALTNIPTATKTIPSKTSTPPLDFIDSQQITDSIISRLLEVEDFQRVPCEELSHGSRDTSVRFNSNPTCMVIINPPVTGELILWRNANFVGYDLWLKEESRMSRIENDAVMSVAGSDKFLADTITCHAVLPRGPASRCLQEAREKHPNP